MPPDAESLEELLGIELEEVGSDRVVATMPVESRHQQPLGYLHGGASLSLAETAASVGAAVACPEGHTAFGMEINANHLRPMRTGRLTAEATPIHRGRTSHVWEVTIRDEADRTVCVSRCTVAIRSPEGAN